MVAAFIGVTIGVAVKATWWWPFLAIFAVAGFGQLLGWSTYTTAEEDPADDASLQHEARSPAS
jgi:predicted negative regulator of RcsB-dependent stress response